MFCGSTPCLPPETDADPRNIAFWLVEGAWDNAQVWTTLSASTRASMKSQYNAAGIKLMVSCVLRATYMHQLTSIQRFRKVSAPSRSWKPSNALSSTDAPTTSGYNPTTLANSLASWVCAFLWPFGSYSLIFVGQAIRT